MQPSKSRTTAKTTALVAVAVFAAMNMACGGRPFNVKARPDMPAIKSVARAEANGVVIQAEAITDEDFLNDTFDANLILAGVLPVRAIIKNEGQEPVDLKKAKFEVRSDTGRNFKLIDAKSAFKQLTSYYEISTYSEDGYKESISTFSSYALDMSKPLGPGESREGLLFFRMQGDDVRGASLTLTASRLGPGRAKNEPAVELKLN